MTYDPFEEQPPAAPDASNFFESGAASCRFQTIGDAHQGSILDFKEAQQRDIQTGEPAHWPDGNKKMMLVVTIKTNERDPEIDDDDGERRLYVNKPSGMFAAISTAIKLSKGKFAVGGTLAVKYVKNGKPKTPGFSPPKEYAARYTPPGEPGTRAPLTAPQGYQAPPLQPGDVKPAKMAAIAKYRATRPGVAPAMIGEELKTLAAAWSSDPTDTWTAVMWMEFAAADFKRPENPIGEDVFTDDQIPF